MSNLPSFEEIVETIIASTGKTRDEVMKLIETLKSKYPVSSDALIAYIVARSLGVNISIRKPGGTKKKTVSDILSMTPEELEAYEGATFTIEGYVLGVSESVAKSTGNRYLRFIFGDKTGIIRGFVWGGKTGELVDEFLTKAPVWSYIEIRGASIRYRERDGDYEVALSLSGKFIDIIPKEPPYSVTELPKKKISELRVGEPARIEATVVAVDDTSYIGCSNCLRKLEDVAEGEVIVCPHCGAKTKAVKLVWHNYYVSDGELTIRARVKPHTTVGDTPVEGDYITVVGVLGDSNDIIATAIKVLVPISKVAAEISIPSTSANPSTSGDRGEEIRITVTESPLGKEETAKTESHEMTFIKSEALDKSQDSEALKRLVNSTVNYVRMVGGKYGVALDEVKKLVSTTIKRNPQYADLDPDAVLNAVLKDGRVILETRNSVEVLVAS